MDAKIPKWGGFVNSFTMKETNVFHFGLKIDLDKFISMSLFKSEFFPSLIVQFRFIDKCRMLYLRTGNDVNV